MTDDDCLLLCSVGWASMVICVQNKAISSEHRRILILVPGVDRCWISIFETLNLNHQCWLKNKICKPALMFCLASFFTEPLIRWFVRLCQEMDILFGQLPAIGKETTAENSCRGSWYSNGQEEHRCLWPSESVHHLVLVAGSSSARMSCLHAILLPRYPNQAVYVVLPDAYI